MGWYGRDTGQYSGPTSLPQNQEIDRSERKSAWARLLAKVYEVDVWACPDCGGRMSVIAVIRPSGVCRVVLIVVPAFGGLRHSRSHRDSKNYRMPGQAGTGATSGGMSVSRSSGQARRWIGVPIRLCGSYHVQVFDG